jgi:hypothetical protein
MYYVTMTDKFLSGWGVAKNKIAKFVYECETMEEAEIVAENAGNRSDQKNINIASKKPSYSSSKYYTQWKNKNGDCSCWYKKGYFKKNK